MFDSLHLAPYFSFTRSLLSMHTCDNVGNVLVRPTWFLPRNRDDLAMELKKKRVTYVFFWEEMIINPISPFWLH